MAEMEDRSEKQPSLMEQARAARCLIETIVNPERQRQMEVDAFMAIFHPERKRERS